MDQGKKNNK